MLNTNDKTAVTNGLSFTALDPQRADGLMWQWSFEPLTEEVETP